MNDTKQQPDIYISYAHRDGKALADTLYQALRKRGYSVFYDQDISPEQMWAEALSQKIRDCSLFLLILTPEAVKSDFVMTEFRFALRENRTVIAITTEDPGSILQENPSLQLMLLDRRVQVISEKAPDAVLARLDEILPAKTQKQPAPEPPVQESAEKPVFISYSSENEAPAYTLRDLLISAGISCWMAPDSIPAGMRYMQAIADAIELCAAMVVLASAESQCSEQVEREINLMISDYPKKLVCALIIDGNPLKGWMRLALQNRQIETAKAIQPGDRGTDRLIASLKKLYPQTPEDRAVKSDISEHRDETRGTARTKEPDAASKPERSSAPSESVSRNLSHAPAIPAQASQTAAEKPPRQQKAAAVYIAAIPAHAAEKAALCDILKRAGIPFCSAPERILTGTQFSPANIAQIGACAAAVVLGNSSSMGGAGTDSIKRLLLSLKKPCYSLLFGTRSTYWENRSTRFDTFIPADKIVPGDRGTDRLIASLKKLFSDK
jgi:hypothetical protein